MLEPAAVPGLYPGQLWRERAFVPALNGPKQDLSVAVHSAVLLRTAEPGDSCHRSDRNSGTQSSQDLPGLNFSAFEDLSESEASNGHVQR